MLGKRRKAIVTTITTPADLTMFTLSDLKNELWMRGLVTTGNKSQLVARLETALLTPPLTKKRKVKRARSSTPVNFSKMKVADLRNELESKGLDTSGKKAELVDRLQGGVAGCALKEKPIEDEVMEETDLSKGKQASPNSLVDPPKEKKRVKFKKGLKMKVAELERNLESQRLDKSGKRVKVVTQHKRGIGRSALMEEEKVVEETDFSDAKNASPNAPVDHSKTKVRYLRKKLESKGLDTSGKKAELVDRLQGGVAGGALKEGTNFSKGKRALKVDSPSKGKKERSKHQKVHSHCYGEMEVYKDWHCMLNQINVSHNNSKFYTMQILKDKYRNVYKLWTRWGHVGKVGQSFEGPNTDLENVIMNFQKKFLGKTNNKWEDRRSFTPVSGKYTLIEDDNDDPKKMVPKLEAVVDLGYGSVPTSLPCTLDKSTQALIQLIFNTDMFNNALKSMDLDINKMPLEKLNREQISKGIEALEAIETAMEACQNKSALALLTSNFYTIIPHDLGDKPPPIIVDRDMLQNKFDMLSVLGDIEIAQGLQQGKAKVVTGELHELDMQQLYTSLNINIELLNYTSHEYQVISKYIMSTAHPGMQLLDVWKVDRHGVKEDCFKEHDAIVNRRLLWYGPNIAMVAATLKYGLRIMPHSGGRVGRGIYLASENSMSIFYVHPARDGTGIMFLTEAALGKECHITVDDFSLTAPPTDYDCVIAKGRTEPDPRYDAVLMLDGKNVVVPQGKSIPTSFSSSRFYKSEYVIYKESQTRIRYMIKIKF